jgi:predicted amidohydrolase
LKRILGPGEEKCFSRGNIPGTVKEYEIYPGCKIGIGIQICAESHSPESSARLADDGAGLLLMPFASPREAGAAPAASMIIGPRGDILSEASGPDESSCTAEISLTDIQKIRESTMGWFRSWPHIKG